MRLLRRLAATTLAGCLSCVAAVAALGITAAPAHAAEGYTYWGYYQLVDGAWQFAQKGPNARTPEGGTVEGWRHATTVGTSSRPPRTDLTFDEICADTEAAEGEKRVGVVLDYGTAEDARDGQQPPTPEAVCAVVPSDTNGAQVLASVADVRVEDGVTCGINGFPATGCSVTVKDASAPQSEPAVDFAVPASDDSGTAAGDTGSDDGVSWGLVGAGALVLVLVGAGAMVARRRG